MKQLTLDPRVSWISAPYDRRIKSPDTSAPIETVYFALEFCVLTRPVKAEILISAHSRYRLYVNKRFSTYGPCKSDEWHRYAERVDIAEWLTPGKNRIIVKTVCYPPRECESGNQFGPHWSQNKACGCCLLVDGAIEIDSEPVPLSTGVADWRYIVSDEMTPTRDFIAHWLGYKEDVDGARTVKPDISEWPRAAEQFKTNVDEYGILPVFPLYEPSIPLLYLREKCFTAGLDNPENIQPHKRAVYLLDAGELTTAFPRFTMSGGGGSLVSIRYAEAFIFEDDGKLIKKRRDDENGKIHGHADVYHPSGQEDVYEPFHFRTFRYIELTVETADKPLTLYKPVYIETGYPLEVSTEPLSGNEQWVQQIWDMSLRTLRRCMHETYEDCPYYEQLQYTMDTRLQILFTYALGGDTRLARKTIHEYHSSKLPNGMLQSRYPSSTPQVIPVFSLHWIFMLRDYYEQTGDSGFIRPYLGTVDQILLYFREHKENGLAAFLGYWETVDWTEVWDDNVGVPHACKYGASTIQNFQYAYALQVAAELYKLYGYTDFASEYLAESENVKAALIEQCWNGSLFREGPDFEEYSQHAQLWAVLAGVGNEDFRRSLLNKILTDDKLIPVSFPTTFYLFRALDTAGLYEQTEALWDSWKGLTGLGLTTIPEISFGNPRSDCHAWGSLMLYEMPRSFLGVRPGGSGWTSVIVEPRGFYVESAEGKVFVPGGSVTVKRVISGGAITVEVTPDCKQPVELRLPDGTSHKLVNNSTSIFTCGIGDGDMFKLPTL